MAKNNYINLSYRQPFLIRKQREVNKFLEFMSIEKCFLL